MAQCVAIDTAGAVVQDLSTPCTGLVLLTPAEYAAIATNPFQLTAEDGFILSVAIIGVWAAAFSIRAVIRALDADEVQHSE